MWVLTNGKKKFCQELDLAWSFLRVGDGLITMVPQQLNSISSQKITHLADVVGYDSVYAYDHLCGGANFITNRDKNFLECFTILSSLLGNHK